MILDPRTDHAVFDGLGNLTIARADGSLSAYGVPCDSSTLSSRERMVGGPVGILPDDEVVILYADGLSGFTPIVGDVVTKGDGTTWTAMDVSEQKYGGLPVSYRVIVRKRL